MFDHQPEDWNHVLISELSNNISTLGGIMHSNRGFKLIDYRSMIVIDRHIYTKYFCSRVGIYESVISGPYFSKLLHGRSCEYTFWFNSCFT